MPDKEEKRPWWKVKRIRGAIVGGIAAVLATIPGSPVIVSLGAWKITTLTVSVACGWVASNVYSYGQGAAVERHKKSKTDSPQAD